jgi:hypothetical protein
MVLSCDQAVKTLLKRKRRWEIRSAGKGSKGGRWYAWAWISTASPRHYLLIRKHLRTNGLVFRYCFVPAGELLTKGRLIRAAGLRWPVEEGFEFGKDCFGLDQAQTRGSIPRSSGAPCSSAPPSRSVPSLPRCCASAPTAKPPNPCIPTTVPEIKHLTADTTTPQPPGHTTQWMNWRRTHQTRSRWFHKRTRLTHNIETPRSPSE